MKMLSKLDALLLCGILAVFIGAAYIFANRYLPPYGAANWSEARKEQSIQIGNEIAAGIEAYYANHQRYPTALEELVPRYLSSIPQPTAGDGTWRYFSRADEFYLQFAVPSGYPSCNYHHKTRQWYEDS